MNISKKPLLPFLIAYILGIILSYLFKITIYIILPFFFLFLLTSILLSYLKKKQAAYLLLLFSFILFGNLAYSRAIRFNPSDHISRYDFPNQKVELEGMVCSFPERSEDRIKMYL
ncbi:MAG: DUF4131 domain-containing protein, partial [bacterium]